MNDKRRRKFVENLRTPENLENLDSDEIKLLTNDFDEDEVRRIIVHMHSATKSGNRGEDHLKAQRGAFDILLKAWESEHTDYTESGKKWDCKKPEFLTEYGLALKMGHLVQTIADRGKNGKQGTKREPQTNNVEVNDAEDEKQTVCGFTQQQVILLFKALGVDFTRGYNKTNVADMLAKLTGKCSQNYRDKLSKLGKNADKDQKIIDDLVEKIKG